MPAGAGLVGTCARTREIINVPDCYADPRFDPAIDRASGLPHALHADAAARRPQGRAGRRDAGAQQGATACSTRDDEALATALAAQCAVALQRVRMTEALIEGEKMRQAARDGARGADEHAALDDAGASPGYDVYGTFRPADLTGGDTFDLALLEQGAARRCSATRPATASRPALSVTQMHAMLRMAFRLGADLDTRVHAGQQPARRDAARRPLHHRVHRPARPGARTGCASTAAARAPILHFDAATATAATLQADELSARRDAARRAAARR